MLANSNNQGRCYKNESHLRDYYKCAYLESYCYHLQFSIADFFINLRQFIFVLNKKKKAALPKA